MSDLTPEERVARVRMALAEAGWPDTHVRFADDKVWVRGQLFGAADGCPDDVMWRALVVAGEPAACWPCWIGRSDSSDCTHDPLTSPWPEVVR